MANASSARIRIRSTNERCHIDKNDYFLIIEVKDRFQGWLPKDPWDWIHIIVPKPF